MLEDRLTVEDHPSHRRKDIRIPFVNQRGEVRWLSHPTPLQNNVVIQNNTTGVVDYLKYEGSTLVASSEHDYGLGPNFKIVADVGTSLVTQNDQTGFVDFLNIGVERKSHFLSRASLGGAFAAYFWRIRAY